VKHRHNKADAKKPHFLSQICPNDLNKAASKLKQEYSIRRNLKNAFKSYISKTKTQVESELSKLVSGLSELNLHPQIEYAVLSKGKRLRPLLVILSAESVGGNRSKVIPLALAFELMHTATLVHDDIIDDDEYRRGVTALHKKWSVNDAILTGDTLIALSVDLASGYGQTVLKTVAQSALELCDGELMDITFSLEKATEESYFKRIREKSASLFSAATYCGAFAAGGTPSEVDSLSVFGENFGIAYQLKDDLFDLTQRGNMALKDLRSGTVTLPLIHSYNICSAGKKKQIGNKLKTLMNGDCVTDAETAKALLQTISQTGSLDYCEEKIDEHLRQAIASVSMLKDTEYKTYLVEMTRALRTWI